ncbi:MAG TPA: helix-turn-helix transcriptional regulator [Afifellaceae bacterium]|nr:helix-turn-helix transcriptional regulator [Afifellaceae bacterium]
MSSTDDEREEDRRLNPLERHVGDRLRLARKAMKFSQEALAEQLGVTFQQVQKYEKGINRISASRLHKAAVILDVPVSFFFPESDPAEQASEQGQVSLPSAVLECLQTREGMDLVRAFSRIADPNVRRHVLQLVTAMASTPRK